MSDYVRLSIFIMHTAHSDAGLFWYDSGVCRRALKNLGMDFSPHFVGISMGFSWMFLIFVRRVLPEASDVPLPCLLGVSHGFSGSL